MTFLRTLVTWQDLAILVSAGLGGVHAWALRHPGKKIDMFLHRVYRTKCRHEP